MKQKALFPKVASDMYLVQMLWTLGFLGILLVVHLIKLVVAVIKENQISDFFDTVFIAGSIYMLVIGIISVSFIRHYVHNGITRKDYFKGGSIATLGLSITIPVLVSVVSAIEHFIVNKLNLSVIEVSNFNVSEDDDSLIADIIQSIVVTPFMDPETNWLLSIILFGLNMLIYYLIGWLISSAFMRLDVVIGVVTVLLSAGLILIYDNLVSIVFELPFNPVLFTLNLSPLVAILGLLLMILVILSIIRLLTKKVIIKI